jgi:preprotein translocase subunit SecA
MSDVVLEYRQTDTVQAQPPPRGLDRLAHGLVGIWRRRPGVTWRLRAQAARAQTEASALSRLDEAAFARRLAEARETVRLHPDGPVTDERVRALAAVAEASARTLGKRPYRVQLMGALALEGGHVAEMATGEGKTLTAGLAAVLAGWTGRPCHVVTTNDYLVERDAALLGPLFAACGISVGCVTAAMRPDERRAAYARDVTYVTSKELLADHLRDRLVLGGPLTPTRRMVASLLDPARKGHGALVMRGLHAVIVDEADSILIDEAMTPLIISAPAENLPLAEAVAIGRRIAAGMTAGADYVVDERNRLVRLTDKGTAALDAIAPTLPPVWRGPERRLDLITQALSAKELFLRDRHYVVQDAKVVIVDEFTGRPMPARSWSYGLHQAVEAKEGLAVSGAMDIRARMSFQDFFRSCRRIAGMTGTAAGVAGELWTNYDLPVVRIPRHRRNRRITRRERILRTEAAKWRAVAAAIEAGRRGGRPVLVGTRSVAASEALAATLDRLGVPCRVVNAVRLAEEADVVARAGEAGAVTIATNMAGRGTDIVPGPGVAEAGGLLVIATERHRARRIDLQLHGRCARQGDPGAVLPFASLEDDLPATQAGAAARALASFTLALPFGERAVSVWLDLLQTVAGMTDRGHRRRLLAQGRRTREALTFTGADG